MTWTSEWRITALLAGFPTADVHPAFVLGALARPGPVLTMLVTILALAYY